MPRTTTKPAKKSKAAAKSEGAEQAPPAGEVLTLAEAAAYLRLPEAEVERLVRTEGLPGRAVGEEWRFLKTALQDWLYGSAPTRPSKEATARTDRLMEGRPYGERIPQGTKSNSRPRSVRGL